MAQSESSNSWLIEIKKTWDSPSEKWHVSKNVCIYKVPKSIKDSNPKAYVPLVVSFGPYHHRKNPELLVKDEHKLEALRRTCTRLQIDVTYIIQEIRNIENKIRDCYDEKILCDGETLSYMFAMDACFILESFKCSMSEQRESDINRFSLVFQTRYCQNTLERAIKYDIMQLENQIPLIVLMTVLQLEFATQENAIKGLADLLNDNALFWGYPFCSTSVGNGAISKEEEVEENLKKVKKHIKQNPCHLLDLCRMTVKGLLKQPSPKSKKGERNLSQTSSPDDGRATPTAELLNKTGIDFKPGQLRFKKRWFGKSTLFFPQIVVDDDTETLLRNLMAYEECQKCSWNPIQTVISHYVGCLDDLIDSENDVSILKKSLVIKSLLGSDDHLANTFNHLGDGITFDGIEEIERVMKDSREHYQSLRKVWMRQFIEEYFTKPSYFVSLFVATLIVALTIVQTVSSVKGG